MPKELFIFLILILFLTTSKYEGFRVNNNIQGEDDCIEMHSFEEDIYFG